MNSKETVKTKEEFEGISLKKLNYVVCGVTCVISVLMLISLYLTSTGYADVRQNTEHYITWEQSAERLLAGSDYLTEQVRAYAVTGKQEYLDNYFVEARVTRRRDKALNEIKSNLKDHQAYEDLQDAMKSSVELMEREYYAMRLTAEAFELDITDYPEEVKNVELKESDLTLTRDKQKEAARNMVFDSVYKAYKDKIINGTQECIQHLAEETRGLMTKSFDRLNLLLVIHRILIIVLVAVVIVVVGLTSFQVIRPLIKAVPRIKEEKPLATEGAYEYKFLAKTYNKMYESNRRQKSQLRYEAMHDVLTGTYNRAGYEEIIESKELENYALLIIDLDNFKHINDTYGHQIGDALLMKAADELKRSFRSSDFICRIGGDEFAVIMNKAGEYKERKELISEKILKINDALADKNTGLPVMSISVGAAFGETPEDFVKTAKNADDALYSVKGAGKHNISFSEE